MDRTTHAHRRPGTARAARRRQGLAMERLETRQVLSANAYIYGIADNNTIWEVSVATKSARAVLDAQPVIGTGYSNAFAYDGERSQFFFIDPQNQLRCWDRGSTLSVLATNMDLGLAASGNQPCNAAYYDDAYWYFTDGTNVLNKVSFTYSDGTPALAGRQTFVVAGAPTLTNTFGDIAIDATTGTLYASNTNGAFYSVDLAAPETGCTLIKPAVDENPGLQLAFNSDYSVLYGQSFTGGQWYTVNTATGDNTPIIGFATIIKGINGLRDVGGSADTPVTEGDLAITKTDHSDTYVPGLALTYTITVTNQGSTTVTGGQVRDVLPTGTTFVSGSAGVTFDASTRTVRYTAGTLAPSASEALTVTILPAAGRTGTLANTATVMTPPSVIDPTPGNNSATDTDTPAPVADLSITKTDGAATYVPGRAVTYTITVTNAGPSAVTGATVADLLPTGTTFVSATGGATFDAGANTVRYTASALGVAGSASFTMTILPAASRTGNLVNTATVAPPAGVTDPTPGNNSATDTDTPGSDTVIVVVADVGCDSTPTVTVIDATTSAVRTQFQVFETAFRGGLRAALGDLDNDGSDEIVVAAGPGRPGEIRVFTLQGVERPAFRSFPFGPAYRDGLEVAVGDVNGDGIDDVVAAKSRGAGEVVVMRSGGGALRPLTAFTAFAPTFQGGAVVTVADIGTFVGAVDRTRPDGRAEVIVGSGTGMAPVVLVYDVSNSPRVVDSFRPLSAAYQAGFSLSAQRINADRIPDLVVSAGRSAAAAVEAYDGVTRSRIASYRAFAALAAPSAQVYAAAADVDGDGWADRAYMTQGTGGASGVQRLQLQSPTQVQTIATSLKSPLRIVTRGPRRLAA